ncbi:MAG: conjugative transposon protein TraM [Agriterribacter sp.]
MEKQLTHSAKFLRQRKFFLLLPLLVFPFMTFLLWSIGLIGTTEAKVQTPAQKGFNMNLPEPVVSKDSNWNKLRFYEQADKDSARYRSLLKNDPYYNLTSLDKKTAIADSLRDTAMGFTYDPYPQELQNTRDPNEAKVYSKLAQLDEALNKNNQPLKSETDKELTTEILSGNPGASVNTADIDRLESMMKTMQGDDNAVNPEMQQINGMLEKILDIQHPDRVKEKLLEQSEKHKGQVFPVTTKSNAVNVSLLQSSQLLAMTDSIKQKPSQQSKFYSLDDDTGNNIPGSMEIPANIPEEQTLFNGATVKLELENEVYINGVLVPRGHFIYGLASMNGDRLTVHINVIRYQNHILPVDLSVYNLDGMEGFFAPGSITRDVAKQSGDQAIQSMSLATLDPSLGAQAANAGIQAVKSLIGKKAKLVKVTAKSGYRVLLRDNNQKNQ